MHRVVMMSDALMTGGSDLTPRHDLSPLDADKCVVMRPPSITHSHMAPLNVFGILIPPRLNIPLIALGMQIIFIFIHRQLLLGVAKASGTVTLRLCLWLTLIGCHGGYAWCVT